MLSKMSRYVHRAFSKEYVEYDGSIIPSPDRRWCGPEFKDDSYYIKSAESEATRLAQRGCTKASSVLDLGCGQGLLAAWLLSARQRYEAGDWPAEWPAPPLGAKVRGVDLLKSDLKRARLALGEQASFEEGDMRHVDFGRADVVVVMDALHFVDGPAQADILRRARIALPPRGLFLTRVGNAGAGLGFHLSQ